MSLSNRFQLMVAALLSISQASGIASDAGLSSECDSMNPSLESDSGDSMLQFKSGAKVQTLSPKAVQTEDEDGPSPDFLKRMQASFDKDMRKRWLSHAPVRQLVDGKSSDWLNGECDITPLGKESAGPCPPNTPDCIFLHSANTHIVPNSPCRWTSPCNTKTLGGMCKCTGTPLTTTQSSHCLGTCTEGCGVIWQDRSSDTCYTYASIEACNPAILTSDDAKLSAAQPVGLPTSLLGTIEAGATSPAAAQGDMSSVPTKLIAKGASSMEDSSPMNGSISELEASCPRYNCGYAHFYTCLLKPTDFYEDYVKLWNCGPIWNWHACSNQCIANLPHGMWYTRHAYTNVFSGTYIEITRIWSPVVR